MFSDKTSKKRFHCFRFLNSFLFEMSCILSVHTLQYTRTCGPSSGSQGGATRGHQELTWDSPCQTLVGAGFAELSLSSAWETLTWKWTPMNGILDFKVTFMTSTGPWNIKAIMDIFISSRFEKQDTLLSQDKLWM